MWGWGGRELIVIELEEAPPFNYSRVKKGVVTDSPTTWSCLNDYNDP